MSSRCPECGGVEVEHNGKLAIQHDRDCDIATDPETICNQTIGLSDILVQSDLEQMSLDAEDAWDESSEVPEFHITALIPFERQGNAAYVEIRGEVHGTFYAVKTVDDFAVTLKPGAEIVLYRMNPRTGLPDESASVEASGMLSSGLTSILIRRSGIEGLTPKLPQVHRIHKPSAHVPVQTESESRKS